MNKNKKIGFVIISLVWMLLVTQMVYSAGTFISVWNTTNLGVSNSKQITLPLVSTGSYNFVVSWGDGFTDTITAYNQPAVTHTYPISGTYLVRITGTINGWAFSGGGDSLKLVDIMEWGPLKLGNTGGYFQGASNLIITATDILNLTGTTILYGLFQDCSSLTTIPNMNEWDISEVTSMTYAFSQATNFNQPLNNWNTGNVTRMYATFSSASSFNQPLNNWNTKKVKNMDGMFESASSFNQDISNWDVSEVTSMSGMFNKASSFNQDISNWNTSSVTDMSYMFTYSNAFDRSIGMWNITKVTDMSFMFSDVNLSTTNYDSILIGWSNQVVKNSVAFDGGMSTYSSNAIGARNILINNRAWIITDEGLTAGGSGGSGSNSAPLMFSSRLVPLNPSSSDTLFAYCGAIDYDNDSVTYNYKLYVNEVLNFSATTRSYPQGTEINVANISSSLLSFGDTWYLNCSANDGTLSSSPLYSMPVTVAYPLGPNIPGWNNDNCYQNCNLTGTNTLRVNGSGYLITDYSFDVYTNTSYNFSYVINNSVGCNAVVSFDYGNCLSYVNFTTQNCFITPTATFGNTAGVVSSSKLLQIPVANSHSTNGKYFKDVRLSLTFSGTCTNVQVSNISLREQKYLNDTIDYDMNQVPSRDLTSENSCCPNDYCWNGTTCVNSDLWTTNSAMPGIWSDGDRGYRCVLNGTSAEWVFSVKHYDWNHQFSGYCPLNSDCFVEEDFEPGSSADCVATNTIMSDDFTYDIGNHYCYDGSWTTKTYLVAQLLINLTEGKPYVLSCHNTTDTTFNTNGLSIYENNPNVLSTCVLIKQENNDPLTDQVIAGIIAKEDTSGNSDEALMLGLISDYSLMYLGISPSPTEYTLAECIDGTHNNDISGTNFSECFKSNNPKAPLFIYYEKNYNYFIVSEKAINGLTPNTFWESIINFFKRLFTSSVPNYNPFINMPLSDYENIYLASNNYGTVTAVEEQKYDSSRGEMINVMFVRYNCSNSNYNIINKEEIISYLSESYSINVNDIQYLPGTGDNQELRITTVARTELWPYFTSTLRHRSDNGIACTGGGGGGSSTS